MVIKYKHRFGNGSAYYQGFYFLKNLGYCFFYCKNFTNFAKLLEKFTKFCTKIAGVRGNLVITLDFYLAEVKAMNY